MYQDRERCYRVARSKDRRFDGVFYIGVLTTGIYCRPSCPAVTPRFGNVRFFPSAAAAQAAGLRACKRCRPDTTPGSPEWDVRADVAGRALRMINDGVIEREGVPGLARRLGYSTRHVHRQLVDELGAGPLALARSRRAQTARILVQTTALPLADVAFAAGFASIRQFNETVREVYAATPGELRRAGATRRGREAAEATSTADSATVELRLATREPFDGGALLDFLALRAVPGVEEVSDGTYRRALDLPHGAGVVGLTPDSAHVRCALTLNDLRDLPVAVERVRRLLDLDADPEAVGEVLGADELLAPLVLKRPGLRVPGSVDGNELAVRAVLGQQVSVAGARTLAGRLVRRAGTALTEPDGALTHLFPRVEQLLALAPEEFPLPRTRTAALRAICSALASCEVELDRGSDRRDVVAALRALPGIGPWTASYLAMRALGDPDVFLPTDLGVRHALQRLGVESAPGDVERLAQRWRPWRSYALLHLWTQLTYGPTDGKARP